MWSNGVGILVDLMTVSLLGSLDNRVFDTDPRAYFSVYPKSLHVAVCRSDSAIF